MPWPRLSNNQAGLSMMKLLIVGDRGGTNVGECFERAAIGFGHSVKFAEVCEAHRASVWLRRFYWHLLGHRPIRLHQFSAALVKICGKQKPDVLLATGLAPITRKTLETIRAQGTPTINYLTDDPWNPSQKSRWFMKALAGYEWVFSPRRANLADLKQQGCRE